MNLTPTGITLINKGLLYEIKSEMTVNNDALLVDRDTTQHSTDDQS